jgi:hypothetical protein
VIESIINKFFANYASSRGGGEGGASDAQGKATDKSGKAESHK